MTIRVFLESLQSGGSTTLYFNFSYDIGSGMQTGNQIFVDTTGISTSYDLKNAIVAAFQAWAIANSMPVITTSNVIFSTVLDIPIQSAATRSLNTAFQIDAIKNSTVAYSVDIATSLSLTTGQVGTVFLETCPTSGFTSGVQELGRFVNGQTGTLTLGLALTQISTANLNGFVPGGYYVRLRTANTTGTPTFTYRSGQEVIYSSN